MDANASSSSLPPQITRGASLRGNEYGWPLRTFPDALRNAEALGYACLGGQFQFRLADGTYEMHWLNADAGERAEGERWSEFSHRSCNEVMQRFTAVAAATDFRAEANHWLVLSKQIANGFDPLSVLFFVAYFVREQELDPQKPR